MAKDNPSLEVKKLNIQKFDITSMARDATICLIGKRRTGKSVLLRDIMYNNRSIPKGLVFSGTEHCNPFFRTFIPDMYISKKYDTNVLQNVFKKQSEIINRDGGPNRKNNMFMVMDDMLANSNDWKKDEQIKNLLMNGRWYNIFFILTMQYPMGIGPELRSNLDYIFIFRENILANRKRLYENFAGAIPNFSTFNTIMDTCTEDHACLVINNNSASNRLEDIVFWYKADISLGNIRFRVGNRGYWALADSCYKEEEDETKKELNVTGDMVQNYGAKNKNYHITIHKEGSVREHD